MMEQIPLGCFWGRYADLVSNSRGQSGHLEFGAGTLWQTEKFMKWGFFGDSHCVLATAGDKMVTRVAHLIASVYLRRP